MKKRDEIEYTYEFKVRFRDTDAYGIVHHSNYYCYFEEARYEFSKVILKLYENQLWKDLKFPVISSECIYKNALSYDLNKYLVKLKFCVVDNVKIEFLYKIVKEGSNKCYAIGRTVHAVVNAEDKLCLTLPPSFQNILEGAMKHD